MENTGWTQMQGLFDSRAKDDFFEFRIIGGKGRLKRVQQAVIDEFGRKTYETIPLKEVGIRAKENRLKEK
ncbi:hypothetical protein MYX82_03740 [Acidobacteria bacterium AH-259-D05]|nr:hypothetical protein [Acidobacteria bacterium AH-259-D05]